MEGRGRGAEGGEGSGWGRRAERGKAAEGRGRASQGLRGPSKVRGAAEYRRLGPAHVARQKPFRYASARRARGGARAAEQVRRRATDRRQRDGHLCREPAELRRGTRAAFRIALPPWEGRKHGLRAKDADGLRRRKQTDSDGLRRDPKEADGLFQKGSEGPKGRKVRAECEWESASCR